MRTIELVRETQFQDFQVVDAGPWVLVSDYERDELASLDQDVIRPALTEWSRLGLTDSPRHATEVWIFRDRDSYEFQSRRRFGEPPGTRFGYYLPRRQAIVVNGATGHGTLLHELSHPIVDANLPACPPWLSEGFACLWEQPEPGGRTVEVRPTWRLRRLQEAIRQGATRPIRDLCYSTLEELNADTTGLAYSQAWSVCYYLHEHGLLAAMLQELREHGGNDPSGYSNLSRLVGTADLAAWQRRWEAELVAITSVPDVPAR